MMLILLACLGDRVASLNRSSNGPRISVSGVRSSVMCPDMKTEQMVLGALDKVTSFQTVSEDVYKRQVMQRYFCHLLKL